MKTETQLQFDIACIDRYIDELQERVESEGINPDAAKIVIDECKVIKKAFEYVLNLRASFI